MTDREELLDELARCFARAAVDALLAGSESNADARSAREACGQSVADQVGFAERQNVLYRE
jgi:hypothetical protein